MKIEPLGDYILIKVDEEETKTESGLLIPTGASRLPQSGKIEAMGPDVERPNLELKVGDRVFFLRYAAIDGPDKDTRLCKLAHIIGKIDG